MGNIDLTQIEQQYYNVLDFVKKLLCGDGRAVGLASCEISPLD